MELKMKIGNRAVDVEWENRTVVSAIMNKLSSKLRITMSRSGNYQIGNIGFSLPCNDRAFIVQPGDICIKSGGKILIYMEEDDVSCTKIGKIKSASESMIKNMLNSGSLTVELFEG